MPARYLLSRRRALVGAVTVPTLIALPAMAADKRLIMTSLQATYSIAHALAKDTAIEVRPGFPADVGMEQQKAHLAKRRRADFIGSAQQADAVISIRRIWDTDPLYPAVRVQNIRAIEIDASTPFAPEMAGVALLETTKKMGDEISRGVSPYIWLSLTNAIRMTDIVASDIRRLSPPDATTIDRNQQQFRGEILALQVRFETRLADIDASAAILLNQEFRYLVADIGVDVAASFAKSDFDRTEIDIATLRDEIGKTGARVVIAAQQPKASVVAAIAASGGRLAILNLMDPGVGTADGQLDPNGFLTATRANLDALLAALAN